MRPPMKPFTRDVFNRYAIWPEPLAVALGGLVRRARLYAGLSQQQVAARSGVSQSVISRFERGLAPGMSVERLIRIADAIGPSLPLGFCPHDHVCAWPRSVAPKPGLFD
jgi:DNA-binding XRE family transcriptional regulator